MIKINIFIFFSIFFQYKSMLVLPFKLFPLYKLKNDFKNTNNIVFNNNNNNLNTISNNIYNFSNFIEDNYNFIMISPIKIGEPPKNIKAFIISNYDNLFIGELSEIQKIGNYNPFNNKNNDYNYSTIEENLYLFKTITDTENNNYTCFTNLKFLIEKNNNNDYPLIIGLTLDDQNYETNFMRQIHDKSIISSYLISFEYINENEGMIIFDKYPHEYNPELYSENEYKSFYSYQPRTMYLTNFVINFDEIYSYTNNEKYFLQKTTKANLILNIGLIIGTNEYMQFIYNNFFNEYIINDICQISSYNSDLKNFFIFHCYNSANFTLNKFPSLNFHIKDVNLTFEFTYKDLFKKINNRYYFLIIFERFVTGYWRFGKPFFLKYIFVYNGDKKTIGFYNKKDKAKIQDKNNDNKNKWKLELNINKVIIIVLLIFILIILIIIISYYLGKKCNMIRKKQANELDDNYEYNSSLALKYKYDKKDINEKGYKEFKELHLELRDESNLVNN